MTGVVDFKRTPQRRRSHRRASRFARFAGRGQRFSLDGWDRGRIRIHVDGGRYFNRHDRGWIRPPCGQRPLVPEPEAVAHPKTRQRPGPRRQSSSVSFRQPPTQVYKRDTARAGMSLSTASDVALGGGTMLLGIFLCLAFLIFDSWILLAAWLYGLPFIFAGRVVLAEGIKGRRESGEVRTSPIARAQPLPSETKRKVWARDGGACTFCGARTDLRFGQVDSQTGDDPTNLRVVCGSCERSVVGRAEQPSPSR